MSTGGVPETGGGPSSGGATGGVATGGMGGELATGGTDTGGTSSGGSETGGSDTGGAGGTAETGGTSSGGTGGVIQVPGPTAYDDQFLGVNGAAPHAKFAPATSLLANDESGDGSALSVVPETKLSEMGGDVTLLADGTFTFVPALKFKGQDSFEYTVQDGDGDTSTALVTIDVTGTISWYVDSGAAAGGDGRETSPFNTLKAAEVASFDGENIFVTSYALQSAGYNAGIVLKPFQTLRGVGGKAIVYNTSGKAVTLADGATVESIVVRGGALATDCASGFTIKDSEIQDQPLTASGCGGVMTFDGVKLGGGGLSYGITLTDVTGSVIINELTGGAFYDALTITENAGKTLSSFVLNDSSTAAVTLTASGGHFSAVTVANTTFNDPLTQVTLAASYTGTFSNVSFDGCTFLASSGHDGVYANASGAGAKVDVSVKNSLFKRSSPLHAVTYGGGLIRGTLTNNTLGTVGTDKSGGADAIWLNAANGGLIYVRADDNQLVETSSVVTVKSEGTGTAVHVNLDGNTLDGNPTVPAVLVDVLAQGAVCANLTNNTISGQNVSLRSGYGSTPGTLKLPSWSTSALQTLTNAGNVFVPTATVVTSGTGIGASATPCIEP